MQAYSDVEVRNTCEGPNLNTEETNPTLFRRARNIVELIFAGPRKSPVVEPQPPNYTRPTVATVTLQQAKLTVIGHATIGDEGAKDLIPVIFHDASAIPRSPFCTLNQLP